MNPSLIVLEKRMRSGLFAVEGVFTSSPDELISNRYDAEFEHQWLRVSDCVEQLKRVVPTDNESQKLITFIAEEAFKLVFKWSANSELAALVYDDIELIAYAVVLGYEDPWLNALLKAYLDHRFPTGLLELLPGRLSEVINSV